MNISHAQLEIRTAAISDALAISELIHDVAQDCLGSDAGIFLETVTQATVECQIKHPQFMYALAFKGHELAGVAALRENTHFYYLFVRSEHQHQGIARLLWDTLKTNAVAVGVRVVTVNSSLQAVPVYKKFGFLPTAEAQIRKGINYVPMQLKLSI